MAVATLKTSGLKVAVKSIALQKVDCGPMVSMFKQYLARRSCSSRSHDSSLLRVYVECAGQTKLSFI